MEISANLRNRVLSLRPEAALPVFGYALMGAVVANIDRLSIGTIVSQYLLGVHVDRYWACPIFCTSNNMSPTSHLPQDVG